MRDQDQLHPFIFDDCDIRGEIVNLNQSYLDILSHNAYPKPVQHLLGEFLAAVGLLSSTLKFEGKIILQVRGDGLISTIMAECNHHKNLRGIVRLNDEDAVLADWLSGTAKSEALTFKHLLGQGVLVITLEPQRTENFGGKLERYQGIVPLERDSLAGCLEDYFQQSEQLSTRLWLSASDNQVSGLLLQALPHQLKTDRDDNQQHWETIEALANTITPDEMFNLPHFELLYRLFNEHPVRVFDAKPLKFVCSCSRERSANALIALGKQEVEELVAERGGIDIDCQFCNQHYHFDAGEARKLFGGKMLH